jgi:hypothetical protein
MLTLHPLPVAVAGHDHIEVAGMLNIPQVNFVDYTCAYFMHFTNWFSNRISDGTIRGVNGAFLPISAEELHSLRSVYATGGHWALRSAS